MSRTPKNIIEPIDMSIEDMSKAMLGLGKEKTDKKEQEEKDEEETEHAKRLNALIDKEIQEIMKEKGVSKSEATKIVLDNIDAQLNPVEYKEQETS